MSDDPNSVADALDQWGDPDEDIDAFIVAHLPEKLRERTCPAGLPHTGDDPASDHGHTDCWFMQLAATEIERTRAERDALAAQLAALTDAIGDPNRLRRVAWDVRGAGWRGYDDYLRRIAAAVQPPDPWHQQ